MKIRWCVHPFADDSRLSVTKLPLLASPVCPSSRPQSRSLGRSCSQLPLFCTTLSSNWPITSYSKEQLAKCSSCWLLWWYDAFYVSGAAFRFWPYFTNCTLTGKKRRTCLRMGFSVPWYLGGRSGSRAGTGAPPGSVWCRKWWSPPSVGPI